MRLTGSLPKRDNLISNEWSAIRMRNTSKIEKEKRAPVNIYLLVAMLGLTTGVSFFIARAGIPSALIFILGVIGLAVAIFMVIYPTFGFYATITSSFFIFAILRFLNTELPLVMVLDVMVYVTFVGVVINKGIKHEPFWENCRAPIMVMYLIIILYNIIEFFNPNGGNTQLYFLIMRRFLTLVLFLYCAIQLFTDLKSIE